MSTLTGRLNTIKLKTAGNREKRGWEQATSIPPEVEHRITAVHPQARRILAQLGFALTLPDANEKYASEIGAALSLLEKSLETQGVLTGELCLAAEKEILCLEKVAKEYTALFAAHAHIDMNWMWGWQETVQSALATFRTMLALMDEYPDFTFSQSQASCYHLVDCYDPDLMEEIKKRIKEGRWEVTASAWVETDKNMPNTESLIRHIRYTKNYLESAWGIEPESLNIDFSPDTFGHSANVPEIDVYGNVKYMYHCRGLQERLILYRWRSSSGAEILSHCEQSWYNRGIQDEIAFGSVKVASMCAGLKTSLIVYGVGDHGGGPTRRDIEHILEMQKWPVYPTLRFGTFTEYFRAAETVRDKLPIFDKEINFIFSGCYTSQNRIKLANRKTEAALLDSEFLDAANKLLTGKKYPSEKLEDAWRKTLFTHFHDILTGSCVRDTREHAMGYYTEAQVIAQTAREKAGTAIAKMIDTSMFGYHTDKTDFRGNRAEGAGPGFGLGNYSGTPVTVRGSGPVRIYHVFNPSTAPRREVVEFVLWDWYYDHDRIEFVDHEGKEIPVQILDKESQWFWCHRYIRFLAHIEIPAGGYATYALREKEFTTERIVYIHEDYPRNILPYTPLVLENEYLRAEFDPGSGALCSLKDKKSGKEKIASGKSAGLVINWAEKSSNSAWMTGRYLEEETVRGAVKLKVNDGNSLRNSFEMELEILRSKITTTVSLDCDAKALLYQYKIDWNEAAKDHKNIPVLCFSLPLETAPEYFQSDVPAGIQKRHGACIDIPGLQYTAAVNGKEATALITDSKYGYRGFENILSATLINTSSNPDPYPERGENVIKLWVALEESEPKTLHDTAFNLCHPVSLISGTGHKGSLPPTKELIRLDSASTVLSSCGITAEGALLVRLYETAGKTDSVRLTLPFDIESAEFVDLDGKVLSALEPPSVKANILSFEIPSGKIRGVQITFKG